MILRFWGGPLDGLEFECPLTPPSSFLLPTSESLVASVYEFNSVMKKGELTYLFHGYTTITEEDEATILSAS